MLYCMPQIYGISMMSGTAVCYIVCARLTVDTAVLHLMSVGLAHTRPIAYVTVLISEVNGVYILIDTLLTAGDVRWAVASIRRKAN